jgi:hypothetical protein
MDVDEAWRLQRQWSVVATKIVDDLPLTIDQSESRRLRCTPRCACGPNPVVTPNNDRCTRCSRGRSISCRGDYPGTPAHRRSDPRPSGNPSRIGEALKGIVYQYLARVEPFSGSDRNANLAEKVSDVERLAADHASLVAGAAPDARAVPHVNGVADYLRKRADDQRN